MDVAEKIIDRRMQACCKTLDPEKCKCPKCGSQLVKRVRDNKRDKLTCPNCDYEYSCGTVGRGVENKPGGESAGGNEVPVKKPPAAKK